MNYASLIKSINSATSQLQGRAAAAVNQALVLRNWMVGAGIVEFEQTGIEKGNVIGRLRPTGLRPKFIEQLEMAGQHLPPTVFGIGSGRF